MYVSALPACMYGLTILMESEESKRLPEIGFAELGTDL